MAKSLMPSIPIGIGFGCCWKVCSSGKMAFAFIRYNPVERPSLGPMRDLVVVGGAAVGRRGSANYVGGCWRSSHIRCRKCTVGYAACNASAHHKAVHRQQRHHRQRSTWRSDHNRLLGSGGSAAASVMSSEAQNAHGARGTVGAVR